MSERAMMEVVPVRPDRPPTLAHRPSRRNVIIDAAIREFARQGFADASISDVARAADVTATAVYYHFSGKDELLSAAVARVFSSISEVVGEARRDDQASDPKVLDAVIDAVWDWIDDHPDEATLFYLQLPGATRQITTLRQEFEEEHVRGAFGYFPHGGRTRTSAARRAVDTLTARTLVDLLISVQTMRLADGPLSLEADDELRAAVHAVAARLVRA
jgi:AcrR family transcriptional regulator